MRKTETSDGPKDAEPTGELQAHASFAPVAAGFITQPQQRPQQALCSGVAPVCCAVPLALLLQSLQLPEKAEPPSVYSGFQLLERRCGGLCIKVESYHALRRLGSQQDDWLVGVTDQNKLVAQSCGQCPSGPQKVIGSFQHELFM